MAIDKQQQQSVKDRMQQKMAPTPPSAALLSALKGTSFRFGGMKRKPRLVVDVTAREGRGKTHFAFTAPDPILYCYTDHGHEGVIEKFGKKVIGRAGYMVGADAYEATDVKKRALMAEKEWARFYKDLRVALASGVKTIVLDTASEFYELLRFARFGKLEQVPPMLYAPVNREWADLIRLVYDEDAPTTNLILLHKAKKEYKKDKGQDRGDWTGGYERQGFNDDGYLVQVGLWLEHDEDEKGKRTGHSIGSITKCRDSRTKIGDTLLDPTFAELAEYVTGIPEEKWFE